MPLLKIAGRVLVVEIAAADELRVARDRLDDVAGWLGRHGVVAEYSARVSLGHDTAKLQAIVREQRPGVLMAGACGHNRLHEWVMGGVTRDLLGQPACCSFVAH